MQKKEYTICLFSENYTGMLNRITIIFTRRKINIESITSSESEIPGIYRYTIKVEMTEDHIIKVVKQIEKLIEVLKAFYYENEQIISREIALYKVHSGQNKENLKEIAAKYGATTLLEEEYYVVFEKTGTKMETQQMLEELKPFGVAEFVRSGRIAISKPMEHISDFFTESDENTIKVI